MLFDATLHLEYGCVRKCSMKGSAMSMLGQVVEGNIITGVFDLCPGGERSREILISVMYQNGKYDVVVLDRLTRKLTRLPIKESRSAKRIGMLLNNIGNPARFVFQTSSVLELPRAATAASALRKQSCASNCANAVGLRLKVLVSWASSALMTRKWVMGTLVRCAGTREHVWNRA